MISRFLVAAFLFLSLTCRAQFIQFNVWTTNSPATISNIVKSLGGIAVMSGQGTNTILSQATNYFASGRIVPFWLDGGTNAGGGVTLHENSFGTNINILNSDHKNAETIFYWGDDLLGAQSFRVGSMPEGSSNARFTFAFLNQGDELDHTTKFYSNDYSAFFSGVYISTIAHWNYLNNDMWYGGTNGASWFRGTNLHFAIGSSAYPLDTTSPFSVKEVMTFYTNGTGRVTGNFTNEGVLSVGKAGADGKIQIWGDDLSGYRNALSWSSGNGTFEMNEGLVVDSAVTLSGASGPSTLSVSNITITGTALLNTGTLLIQSNTYPITSWSATFGGKCGCITWMSNATCYFICTNTLDHIGTTNRIAGL